ncbi:hypothetical protein WICPIJ_004616 [Wickerhamomyces pijperi]|uniref:Large ribosomal subunit protein mL54 n=1 Tax=Wickerhamomyces pijperi TaxID=599730 RepID=A0A9P8Q7L0_WICPI|nr:hypothetical protein WICPIJ_004616 [Wickerhamomyces pijperi]
MLRLPIRRLFSTSSFFRNATASATPAPAQTIKSACAAGTPLNLKIKKSGQEPVALEDSEYPAWLWEILDPKLQQQKLEQDPAKLAKKDMKLRNKKKIKMNNFMEQMN